MKFIAKFKVYNGEASYTIPVVTEKDKLTEAEEYFKSYECENEVEIWKLQDFEEVKTLQDLWMWLI